MNKIAQRRGLWEQIKDRGITNVVTEKLNTPVEWISSKFSPEFVELMGVLRDVDDEAREAAVDLKDLLNVARSNFNRREYMVTISKLGIFQERADEIMSTFNKLLKEVNMTHNEFLFGDLDDEHRKNLFEIMPQRFKPIQKNNKKIKNAGVKDWWHNLTSDRGKSLKLWEKRFPKASKEIKSSTEKMLNKSQIFLNMLMSSFKTLASYRATRDLEGYVKLIDSLGEKFKSYDRSFNEYFNTTVVKFINSQKEFEASKNEEGATVQTSGNVENDEKESSNVPVASAPDATENKPAVQTKTDQAPAPKQENKKAPVEKLDLMKDLDEDIEKMNKPKSGWPVREEEEEEPSTQMNQKPPSSEPPSSGERKVVPQLPAKPESVKADVKDVEEDFEEEPVTETLRSFKAVAPVTQAPTSLDRSPFSNNVPPPASTMPTVSIPKVDKVPNVEELNKPLTQSQADKFIYHTPPQANEKAKPATTVRPGTINDPKSNKTAAEFIEGLNKMADQNPLVIAKEIIAFAKSIEISDKSTSDRLLLVAKKLIQS